MRIDWRHIVVPAVYITLIGVVVVFAHSGLQGSHGLGAHRDAVEERASLEAEKRRVVAERLALANKVSRLSERALDLELLDERARAVLGYVRNDEITVR